MMINRRGILRGLVAAPAIIAADRLMPIRGLNPLVAVPDGFKGFYFGGITGSGVVPVSFVPEYLRKLVEQDTRNWLWAANKTSKYALARSEETAIRRYKSVAESGYFTRT